jgi:uncharacterized protein YqjF (DUF2071 family)
VRYRSARPIPPAARFEAEYGPVGPVFQASPGSLEHFLAERYCLYALAPDGRIRRTEIHHQPWPLQPANGEVDAGELLAAVGLPMAEPPPLLHFARRIDVVVWLPHPLGAPTL